MIKKVLIASGVSVMLLGFFFGRDAVSYVRTTVAWMHDGVKESVPIEFEIDRARGMITDLAPEIRRNMRLIAREEVEVNRLAGRVDSLQDELTEDRQEMIRLQTDLDSGGSHFTYCGTRYSASQVRSDLTHRFDRYQTRESTLQNLSQVLHARRQGLSAAREKLEGMLASKRELEADVANLEARLKMVEVAQTTSDFNFDDSQLARTREMIGQVQTRIEVAERMVAAETTFHDEIPLQEPVNEDISERITAYFGASPEQVASD